MEGQGRGIIMEVTRPLFLGPFYLLKWPVNPNISAASVCLQTLYILQSISDCIFKQYLYESLLFENALTPEAIIADSLLLLLPENFIMVQLLYLRFLPLTIYVLK